MKIINNCKEWWSKYYSLVLHQGLGRSPSQNPLWIFHCSRGCLDNVRPFVRRMKLHLVKWTLQHDSKHSRKPTMLWGEKAMRAKNLLRYCIVGIKLHGRVGKKSSQSISEIDRQLKKMCIWDCFCQRER